MNITKISVSLGEKVNLERHLGPKYKYTFFDPQIFIEAETSNESYEKDLADLRVKLFTELQDYINYVISRKKEMDK